MKKTLSLLVATCCFAAVSVHAQGTIQFLNSALSKLKYTAEPGAPTADMPVGAVVGVFWGRSADALTLAENTVVITTPGLFNGGTVYALPGSEPGQSVFLKIAAWYNSGGTTPRLAREGPCTPGITHYGESAVVQTTALGPTAGPGTVVFQGPSGTNPNRAKPFEFQIGVLCPEPSTWAILAVGLGTVLLRQRKGR